MDRVGLRSKHLKTLLSYELKNLGKNIPLIKNTVKKLKSNEIPEDLKVKSIEHNNLRNIVVLPNIPWNYRWQRPQQISSRLANLGYCIFYISPITQEESFLTKISENIFEVHLATRTRGNALRDFHLDKENSQDFIESLKKILKEFNVSEYLLFTLHPVWKDVAPALDPMKRVYDLMDLYSGFPEAREDLIVGEEKLIKDSDIVLSTAESLFKYAKEINGNVHLVRNGVDSEKFSKLEKNGVLEGIRDKPIIGYFGAITDWVDFGLLEYVIKDNLDKNFVFLGSVNSKGVRNLYKFKNVFFLGEVEHDDLTGYLAYFDVCLIPFVLNDLIKSTNPVKFYEYIASGKPVVTVNLPELEQYSDICYLSEDKKDFSRNIFKALHEYNEEIVGKRIETAKENSWDKRVEDLIQCVDSL